MYAESCFRTLHCAVARLIILFHATDLRDGAPHAVRLPALDTPFHMTLHPGRLLRGQNTAYEIDPGRSEKMLHLSLPLRWTVIQRNPYRLPHHKGNFRRQKYSAT